MSALTQKRLDSTRAVEDYAKAIYELEADARGEVSTNDLATKLGVTAGSVSGMVKKLDEDGLLAHSPYRGVTLTDAGRRMALEVVRRHRLIESLLLDLGLPWDRVHAQAELLEHFISDEVVDLIERKLGVVRDPHGDPIPSAALEIHEAENHGLDELAPGDSGRFVRILDSQRDDMLRYLTDKGIELGDSLQVLEREPFGGSLDVEHDGRRISLGAEVARAMRIEPEGVD